MKLSPRWAVVLLVAIALAFGAVNVLATCAVERPEFDSPEGLLILALMAAEVHLIGTWLALAPASWPRRLAVAGVLTFWFLWSFLLVPSFQVGSRQVAFGFAFLATAAGGILLAYIVQGAATAIRNRRIVCVAGGEASVESPRSNQFRMGDLMLAVLAVGIALGALRLSVGEPSIDGVVAVLGRAALALLLLTIPSFFVINFVSLPFVAPAVWIALADRPARSSGAVEWSLFMAIYTLVECFVATMFTGRGISSTTLADELRFFGVLAMMNSVQFFAVLLPLLAFRAVGLRTAPRIAMPLHAWSEQEGDAGAAL